MGCCWGDGILLLLLYSYIIIIPVVHGRFAATATASAVADRCSLSLISPSLGCRRGSLVVAGVMLFFSVFMLLIV